jgi:hypothetical protein
MKKPTYAFLLILLAAPAVSEQISVRFKGGMNYISPKEYNDAITGRNAYLTEKVAIPPMQGSLSTFRLGWNLDGEVVLSLMKNLSLGLGVGYTRFATDDRLIYKYPTTSPTLLFGGTYHYKTSVAMVPVAFKFHYSRSLTKSIMLTAGLGPGLYLCSFKYAFDYTGGYMGATDWNSTQTLAAHKNVLGFEGEVGFEIPLVKAIFAEIIVGGRFAKLSEFKGDYSEVGTDGSDSWDRKSNEGYLFFYDYERDGKAYRQYGYNDSPNPIYTNFQKGIINLSGLFVKAGIRIAL